MRAALLRGRYARCASRKWKSSTSPESHGSMMESQNQDHHQGTPSGERFDRASRTFTRRIDCAAGPRAQGAAAAQHGRGPGADQAAD